MPWLRRCFLVGEILFKSRILWNSFLIGLFLIRVKRGVQDISLYTYVCRPSHAEPVSLAIRQCLLIVLIYIENLQVRPSVFKMDRQSFRGIYGHVSKVVSFHKFVNFTSKISTYQEARFRGAYKVFASTMFVGICVIWVYRLTHIPRVGEQGIDGIGLVCLRLSTGWAGSSLCPTRTRPECIEWGKV